MYKHQVVGVRQERSWRSRNSKHIVGICTLEALDRWNRFADLTEEWKVKKGRIVLEDSAGGESKPGVRKEHPALGLKCRCRHWTLEEVIVALRQRSPGHEFYTRDPDDDAKIPVEIQDGNWIKTVADSQHPGNLRSLDASQIPCPRANCDIIPKSTRPVFRADGPDC